jgi:secreted PhoX family phosphatase
MALSFEKILKKRLTRRQALVGAGVAATGVAVGAKNFSALSSSALSNQASSAFALGFASVPKGYTEGLEVTKGYDAKILMRWGDSLQNPQAPFKPMELTAEQQAESFGYNNDFLAYLPLNGSSEHGLLHVNHEYTNAHLMFPDVTRQDSNDNLTQAEVAIEKAAHGVSVLEVKRHAKEGWQVVPKSHFARRITGSTPIHLSGPVTGHKRLQTLADPKGRTVLGTLSNCSGGVTPWGTVLVAEENINGFFQNYTNGAEAENHKRYTIAKRPFYGWSRFDERFDVSKHPNEPNRFGWVVEYNPYNPSSQPVKRTALGRFFHESATVTLAPDNRVVVYSGDDSYFEYLYRYVSRQPYDPGQPDSWQRLLDDGTLYAAKFNEDGSMQWLPLRYGEKGLTDENDFHSQADVLIEARRAGDVVGATPMDRPEGIAIHPETNTVTVSLTKNPKRKETNPANPRPQNDAGHLLSLHPPKGDHAADSFQWSLPILAGDPDEEQPKYPARPTPSGWFGNPDNLAYHPNGSLWIATDGMPRSYGFADGLYATDGQQAPKCFLRSPRGAEVTGPCFTPDGETLFLSIQHPGDDAESTMLSPTTRWPDFNPEMPPRPSVIAITKN